MDDEDVVPQSFADKINKAMRNICKQFGGPRQFLQATYPDKESQLSFVQQMIQNIIPPSTAQEYHNAAALPMVATQDIITTSGVKRH